MANKSASQLFGNKISDMLETLAKEHQLHFIFKDKEKSSTSSVKCKYNGLLNGGLLQRPRRGQTTIQGKNKSTHKKTRIVRVRATTRQRTSASNRGMEY